MTNWERRKFARPASDGHRPSGSWTASASTLTAKGSKAAGKDAVQREATASSAVTAGVCRSPRSEPVPGAVRVSGSEVKWKVAS